MAETSKGKRRTSRLYWGQTGRERTMAEMSKGKSPFYPGQPVPVELFVGRKAEIERILTRGVAQVTRGKPVAIFTRGEYGIGKSSIAGFVQSLAEREEYGLHGIYATLGGSHDLNDMAAAILEATLRSGALDPRRVEKLRNLLAKYVGPQQLFGIRVDLTALRQDAPNFSTPFGMLSFLSETRARLKETGVKGIFLVLDEINGMTSDPQFANFIKGLVDSNAMSKEPLPLLLMLCGVEERRREMIQKHQPVERIFDVVEIGAMTEAEMKDFFNRAFESVQMKVEDSAMFYLTHYSAGFPKIMHLIGDAAYWLDKDGLVDEEDAINAVRVAAGEVGSKYVDQQIYSVISKDYRSILRKIAGIGWEKGFGEPFHKAEITKVLTESEHRKFNNFLRRMETLRVIRHGEERGEYVFTMRMVELYIWMDSIRQRKEDVESST